MTTINGWLILETPMLKNSQFGVFIVVWDVSVCCLGCYVITTCGC